MQILSNPIEWSALCKGSLVELEDNKYTVYEAAFILDISTNLRPRIKLYSINVNTHLEEAQLAVNVKYR